MEKHYDGVIIVPKRATQHLIQVQIKPHGHGVDPHPMVVTTEAIREERVGPR
jgi:hypothetical protein